MSCSPSFSMAVPEISFHDFQNQHLIPGTVGRLEIHEGDNHVLVFEKVAASLVCPLSASLPLQSMNQLLSLRLAAICLWREW